MTAATIAMLRKLGAVFGLFISKLSQQYLKQAASRRTCFAWRLSSALEAVGRRMCLVQVRAEKVHIAQVRAVEHVAHPADERNGTDHEVDTDIAHHAQERRHGHAKAARLPDQV